jgi:plastocyanin
MKQTLVAAASFLLIVLAVPSSWATTHVVQFGGGLGYVYSPADFSASVGDTVKWEGSFTTHPLSSTSVPLGAQAWHSGSGTVFSYVITVPGNYDYQCDYHYAMGMIGSFEVTASGVQNIESNRAFVPGYQVSLVKVPLSRHYAITFSLQKGGPVSIEIFDLLGKKVRTLGEQALEAGTHTVSIGAYVPADGFYFVKITGATATLAEPGKAPLR